MASHYSLAELAEQTAAQLQGDGSYVVSSVASVEQAGKHDISYIRGGKFRHFLHSTQAGALILPPELAGEYAGPCLVHADPYLIYARVTSLLHPVPEPARMIHPTAVIAEDVQLGDAVSIGPHAVIEAGSVLGDGVIVEAGCFIGSQCRIGENSRLYPNVTVAYGTQIGKRAIIHSGAVLGADGFGFVPTNSGWYKINQIGNVVLGDDVDVGANTTIDRAAMGSTYIGNGVKLDNLIQVAHNVQIGEHSVIAGSTGIAGSTKIGSHCRIGGQCGISGHLTIVDHVTVTGRSFVASSIHKAGVYSSGTTVEENPSWRKNAIRFHQLDKLARRLAELEKELAALRKTDN